LSLSTCLKQIAEHERNKKLTKYNEEFLKNKSFFELVSYLAKQGAVEFKKLVEEFKDSPNEDYRYSFLAFFSFPIWLACHCLSIIKESA
jgi:hypothetical protein